MAGVNPRWVKSMIQHRGLPDVSLACLEHGIGLLSKDEIEEFHDLVFRLHNGRERDGDMSRMSEWLRATRTNFESTPTTAPSREEPSIPPADEPLAQQAQKREPSRQDVYTDPARQLTLHPESRGPVRTSLHVYGKSAALCVEPTVIDDTDIDERTPPYHTLSIEVAPSAKQEQIKYRWDRKILFRLTKRELPLFAACMMGWMQDIQFDKHGPAHDKCLSLSDQGAHLFLRLREAGVSHSIQIPQEEVFGLATMALETVCRNTNGLDSQTVVMALKRISMMSVPRT